MKRLWYLILALLFKRTLVYDALAATTTFSTPTAPTTFTAVNTTTSTTTTSTTSTTTTTTSTTSITLSPADIKFQECKDMAGTYTLQFMVNLTKEGAVTIEKKTAMRSFETEGFLNQTKVGCQGQTAHNQQQASLFIFIFQSFSSILYMYGQRPYPIVLRKPDINNREDRGIIKTAPELMSRNNKFLIRGCLYEYFKRLPINDTYWTHNGKVVSSSRYTQPLNDDDREAAVDSTNGLLKLFATPSLFVQAFDQQGTYRCIVKLPMFRNTTFKSEELNVTADNLAPTFVQNPTAIYNNKGEKVLIQGCIVHSLLPLSSGNAYYQLNNDNVINSELIRRHSNGLHWEFSRIVLPADSNSSTYQCAIQIKGLSRPMLSEPVNVKYGDENIIYKSGPNKKNGSVIIHGCEYRYDKRNTPPIHSYWLFNGARVNSNGKEGDGTATRTNGTFRTPSYTIDSYEKVGSYQCELFIEIFNLTFTSTNIFVGLPDLPVPRFVHSPTAIFNTKDEPLLLQSCTIESSIPLSNAKLFYQRNNSSHAVNGDLTRKLWNGSLWEFPRIVLHGDGNASTYLCKIQVEGLITPILSEPVHVEYEVEKRIYQSGPTKSHKTLVINGCRYQYHKKLPRIRTYLLHNGKRIEQNENNTSDRSDDTNIITTPSYTIDSYDRIGSYHCEVFIEEVNVTFLSRQLFVGVKDLPDITFVTAPEVSSHNISGDKISLGNCTVLSELPLTLDHCSYLKDGFETILLPAELSKKNGRIWTFPTMTLINTTFRNEGYYQCLVHINGTKILSTEVNIHFKDVSAIGFNMKIKSRKFRKEYLDRSTEEFKNLEKQVVHEIATEARQNNWIPPNDDATDDRDFIKVLSFRRGSVIADVRLTLPKQNETTKASRCKQEAHVSSGKGNIELQVSFLDCCTIIREGSEGYKGIYVYDTTLIGNYYEQNCKYPMKNETILWKTKRLCIGSLKDKPRWEKANLENCGAKGKVTNDLIELEKITEDLCNKTSNNTQNCETPLVASSKLVKLIKTSPGNIAIPEDVSLISDIVTNIIVHINFEKMNLTTGNEITNNVLDVIDNLVKINETLMQNSKSNDGDNKPAAVLLENLNELAKGMGSIIKGTNRSVSVSKSSLAFEVVSINPSDFTVIASENSQHAVIRTMTTSNDSESLRNMLASFRAENLTLNHGNDSLVYSYFFRKSSLFQGKSNSVNSTIVGTNILAVTIVDLKQHGILSNPVNITFEKREVKSNIKVLKQKCSFWNVSTGRWDGSGCRLLREDNIIATCQCNHLTNFAMLFDVAQKQYNPLPLSIITWVGCGISLTGLLLTIITYLKFPKLLQKLPGKILLCLTISMTLLLVTFLGGVDRPEPRTRCQIIASLIQYFILSTFAWMGVEAFNMYKSFVKVFGTGGSGQKTFMIWSSVIAWGVSCAIVIATGFIAPQNLGTKDFCVVMGFSFYFGVLLPIGVVLLFNFTILVFVMRALNKRTVAASQQVGKISKILRKTKIALACSVLLGLTWFFGLFAIDEAALPFQWLFTIFNSLQGFFIFVFYTLTSPEVQKEWKKVFGRYSQWALFDHTGSHTSTTLTSPVSTLNRCKKYVVLAPGNHHEPLQSYKSSTDLNEANGIKTSETTKL